MALTSEGIPDAGGPNASLQFGEATENKRLQQEVASSSGTSTPTIQAPRGGAPMAPPPPQQAPPMATQPEPRLNLGQVFPPMPELQPPTPWRQQLRQQAEVFAAHPQHGPAWERFTNLIRDQRGPLR